MPEDPRKDAKDRFQAEVMPLLPMLYRTALMLTHHEQAAEDLVQEAMLRAYRHIETFRPGTHMKAWLMTILRRAHIDGYRREKARVSPGSLEAIEHDPPATPSVQPEAWDGKSPEVLLDQVDDDALDAALRALPETMRWVLLLVDVEQLSIDEAAAVLDVPAGTIKSRASRGRAALRDRLGPVARERGWVA